jgi:uncharacterized protein YndB with AHSA1/START domain
MTVAINTPAPVRKTVHVAVAPEKAFDVFTARMGKWWMAEHSILKAPRESVVMEPRQGGRWYETAVDGTECSWGYVITWEPPNRVVLAWQIDGSWQFNEKFLTEIEVRFTPDGPNGTRVELEHRKLQAYGETAESMRAALDGNEGWGAELANFVAATLS